MKDKGKRIKVSYAKELCAELRCQIHIGMDIGYILKDICKKWIAEATETSAMLSGLIKQSEVS